MNTKNKFLSIVCLITICLFLLASCGGSETVTDTDTQQGTNDTQDTVTDTTDYSQKTFNTYSSDGNYFFSTTEIPTFIDDNAGLRLSALDSQFAFSADCKGAVVLKLNPQAVSQSADKASFEIYIDGELINTMTTVYGEQNVLIAESLDEGVHTFAIKKRSGGDLIRVDAITLRGELREAPRLNVENGLWVEVFAPAGDDEYSSFNIYTQTTHPSGDYYIRYKFVYEYDDIDDSLNWSNGSNTGANRMNYRIKTAQIVKKTGDPGFLNIHEILQGGEISLAIKEYDPITGKNAGDFVGGYHGDENLKSVSLLLDGTQEIKLLGGEPGFYNCSSAEFVQFSTINRCHTFYDKVMNHDQHYLIDTNGIRLLQKVEWLVDNFTPATSQTYIQMFTLNRLNPDKAGDFLTTNLALLNEDGKVIARADLTAFDPGDKEGVSAASSPDARYAEYFGDSKGIYAKVGFQFVDDSVMLNSTNISVRKHGDSKWYPSFGDPQGKPSKGDVWTINSIYYIDYNPAE